MKTIEINSTTEFHLLRHFKNSPANYSSTLVGKSHNYFDYSRNIFVTSVISEKDISDALETLGGKFESVGTYLQTPVDILKICQSEFKNREISWVKHNVALNTSFEVELGCNVGRQNLIKESKLSELDQKRIFKSAKSKLHGENNLLVKVIENYAFPLTNKIRVEIVDTPELPFLWVSAYPFGKDLEIDEQINFWDQVVFVK